MWTLIGVIVLVVIMLGAVLYFSGKSKLEQLTSRGHDEIRKDDKNE